MLNVFTPDLALNPDADLSPIKWILPGLTASEGMSEFVAQMVTTRGLEAADTGKRAPLTPKIRAHSGGRRHARIAPRDHG